MNIKRISITVIVLFITGTVLNAQYYRRQSVRWNDDSHYIQSQKDKKGNDALYLIDAETGKAKKFKEKEQVSFRSQLPKDFRLGYGDPVFNDEAAIKSQDEDLYYFKKGMSEARRITANVGLERNPTFSPNGKFVAFTREHDLYAINLETGLEQRLTYDGSKDVYSGYAAWVYYEEILGRGSRYKAFWWSPDASKIAFLRFDEAEVPFFTLVRSDGSTSGDFVHGDLEVVHYPKPGDPNPKVKLGIFDFNTGETAWLDIDENIDQYVAWPFWTPDSKELLVQVVNRDQNHIKFLMADPSTGKTRKIYDEKNNTWLEFYTDLHLMEDGSGFIVRSDKSGWRNLYYYDFDGNLIAQLGDVDFRVNRIQKICPEKNILFFNATGPESTESHLFVVNLDGTSLKQLTTGAGSHQASISPNGSYIIDAWSGVDNPSRTELINASNGKLIRKIKEPELTSFDPKNHCKTDLVKITTDDGLFDLPVMITYPPDFDKNKKYPVIFQIYGGPDAGGVRNSYRGYNGSSLNKAGIITVSADHRGSGKFGKKGMDYMHRNLGKWEMTDYITIVKWLRQQSYVDAERMGITGGSYGGYVTAMALTYGADYFTHGIANFSVTSWRLYDNVYTERYMDTPEQNPEGYKVSAVMEYADKLKGKLYIIHGEMDDNVHPQNSLQLISVLQDKNKDFEFMIYPNGRHGWGGAKAQHLARETNDFWMKHFFGK